MQNTISKFKKIMNGPKGPVLIVFFCVIWVLISAFLDTNTSQNFKSEEKNAKIAIQRDLGFTFIDFAKRYNSMVTVGRFGPNYELYTIKSKELSEHNTKDDTSETHCQLDDWITVLVKYNVNTNKVLDVTVSGFPLNRTEQVAYLCVVTNVVHVINGHDGNSKNCECDMILKSLGVAKQMFINEWCSKKYVRGNFKYTLTGVPDSSSFNTPHLLFNIEAKE